MSQPQTDFEAAMDQARAIEREQRDDATRDQLAQVERISDALQGHRRAS
jgi:hypothetical protein